MKTLIHITTLIALFLSIGCGDDEVAKDPIIITTTSGLNACEEAGECLYSCETDVCTDLCIEQDPEAAIAFIEIVQCALNSCPEFEDDCMKALCPSSYDTCANFRTSEPVDQP